MISKKSGGNLAPSLSRADLSDPQKSLTSTKQVNRHSQAFSAVYKRRPLSNYKTEQHEYCNGCLKDLLKACADASISPKQYREMQKRVLAFTREIDDIDIWYNRITNKFLHAVDGLRKLEHIASSQITPEIQKQLKEIIEIFDYCSNELVSKLSAESVDIFRSLIRADFSPSPESVNTLKTQGRAYLPLDIFQHLYQKELHESFNPETGLMLLTMKPATVFHWWYEKSIGFHGEKKCNSLLKAAFWKNWRSEEKCSWRDGINSDFENFDFIWRLVTIPTLMDCLKDNRIVSFEGNGSFDIIPILDKYKSIFDLIICHLCSSNKATECFLKLPEVIRPYVLWALSRNRKFTTVNSIISEFPDYKYVLTMTDLESGNSCLHFDPVYSETGKELKDFVINAGLESLFGKRNSEGMVPVDVYGGSVLLMTDSDYAPLLEFLDLLSNNTPKKSIEGLLKRFVFGAGGRDPLVFAVTWAMQHGFSMEFCRDINSHKKYVYENDRNLEKAFLLLSRFLPIKVQEYKKLGDELMKAGFHPEVIIEILSVLPEAFSVPVMNSLLCGDDGGYFLQGVLNTGLIPLPYEFDQKFPWTDLLVYGARHVDIPAPSTEMLTAYQEALAKYVRSSCDDMKELPECILASFKNSENEVGVYGRSLYCRKEGSDTLRVKSRKRHASGCDEPLEELTREAGVLTFLREQQELFQSSGGERGLDIRSQLPRPEGNFYISDPAPWLELPAAKKARLGDDVAAGSGGGPLPVYLFKTRHDELYHRYVYEREGEPGLSRENSLKGLRLAAHDIGVLFRNGFSVNNALPLFHNRTAADMRRYNTLNQLTGRQSQGGLMDWNGKATCYPNISPSPVGMRDFAEIDIHQIRHALMVLGNNMLALELELALTLNKEFSSRDPKVFRSKVKEVKEEILILYQRLFGAAFGMPEGSESRKKLGELLQTSGLVDQAAREMVYWCETGDNPGWVKDVKAKVIPGWVYPDPDQDILKKFKEMNEFYLLKPQGFMCSTHNPDLNLGRANGWILLAQSNCMKTLAIAAANLDRA